MDLPCLGIDIAKVMFNVCLLQSKGKLKYKVFPNNAAGFAQLQEWLRKLGVAQLHACLEATGTYGEALALHLQQLGHIVSVMNPAAIKAAEENRLSAGVTVAAVRSSVEEMIAHLKDQITRTEKLIRKHKSRQTFRRCEWSS